MLEQQLALARALIRHLIGLVRQLTDKVTKLTDKNVCGRFVKFVESLATPHGALRMLPESLTEQEVAARIGGSRKIVNRILKDLVTGG